MYNGAAWSTYLKKKGEKSFIFIRKKNYFLQKKKIFIYLKEKKLIITAPTSNEEKIFHTYPGNISYFL